MEGRKDRIVRIAKQNRWFRYCLIGVYLLLAFLAALRKKRPAFRMKLTACLTVIALCLSQVLVVTVYAEEMAETAAAEDMEPETGPDAAQETETEDTFNEEEQEENESGESESAGNELTGENETDGGETQGKIETDGSETQGENETGGNKAQDEDNAEKGETADGNNTTGEGDPDDAASDKDSMKDDQVIDSDDVSGNSPAITPGDMDENDSAAEPDKADDSDIAIDPDEINDENNTTDSGDVSGNDPEETELIPEEVQLQYIPQLSIEYRMKEGPTGILIGNASSVLALSTISSYIEPEEEGGIGMSPAVCAYGSVDGETLYVDLQAGTAEVSLPDNFYGSILFSAEDAEGNTCEVSTSMMMFDASAPVVFITETELSDGSKQFLAIMKDSGAAATGIAKTSCFINDVEAAVEYEITGVTENCFGQAVVSEAVFPLPLEESGRYTVKLEAQDHAGNVSSYVQELEIVQMRGPICVTAPSRVALTINPWTDGEQIYSDNFTIENKSGYDIIATLQNVHLTVNRKDVGGDPARKDCSLYLFCDMWGDVSLPEGNSGELLSVRIPAKKEDGAENSTVTMHVHGSLSDGSEMLWRDKDVKLELSFDYKAAPLE